MFLYMTSFFKQISRSQNYEKPSRTSLKSYTSGIDLRAWSGINGKRSKYLEDLITNGNDICREELPGILLDLTKSESRIKIQDKLLLNNLEDDIESIRNNELNQLREKAEYCEKLLEENKTLKFDLANLRKDSADYDKLKKLPDILEEVINERNQLQKAFEQITKSEDKILNLRNRALEADRLMMERNELFQQCNKLKDVLGQQRDGEKRFQDYQNEIDRLNEKTKTLESNLNKIQSLYKNARDSFLIVSNDLNNKVEYQRKQMEELFDKNIILYQLEHESSEEINLLRNENELKILKLDYASNENNKLKNQIDDLKKKLLDISANNIILQSTDEINKNRHEILLQENQNLRQEVDKLVKYIELEREKNCELEDTVDYLKDQIKEAGRKSDSALYKGIVELEKKFRKKEDENILLRENLENIRTELSDTIKQRNQSEEKLQNFKNCFETQNKNIADLSNNIQFSRKECDQYKILNKDLADQLKDQKNKIEKLNDDLLISYRIKQEALDINRCLKIENEENITKLGSLQNKILSLKNKIDDYEKQMAFLTNYYENQMMELENTNLDSKLTNALDVYNKNHKNQSQINYENDISKDCDKKFMKKNNEEKQETYEWQINLVEAKYEAKINKLHRLYENHIKDFIKKHNNEIDSLKQANESLRISLRNIEFILKP